VETFTKGHKIDFRKDASCHGNKVWAHQWAKPLPYKRGERATCDGEIERSEETESILWKYIRYAAHPRGDNKVSIANRLDVAI
jgi:hypothetical protein